MKTLIKKPWGSETLIEYNKFYVLKKLKMKKNHQCSLQFHKKKMNEFEREQFLEEYLKPSYYTPIIGSKMDEEAQFYLLKKDKSVSTKK